MDSNLGQQLVELLPRLRRFAYGLTGNVEKADELLQAACERALAKSVHWQVGSRLDYWMYRIIRNLHIDELRALDVRKRSLDEISAMSEQESESRYILESQIAAEEVHRAMQGLSEDHRTILLLVGVEGYSYKEVAEILQIPMGTVTSRLIRARKALIGELSSSETKSPSKEAVG